MRSLNGMGAEIGGHRSGQHQERRTADFRRRKHPWRKDEGQQRSQVGLKAKKW